MIRRNIDEIREHIATACAQSGRSPSEVTLVAVSKTFPADRVREVVAAGVPDIGENYVQELLHKREELAGVPVRWHFIGHLQSNKVKYIAEWVHLVHAVESHTVAQELERRAVRAGRAIDILIEVNTTGEASKYGVPPDTVVGFVKSLAGFSALRVAGLMTMGPFLPDPECSRPMFRQLRALKEELAQIGQPNVQMQHLSMGMTNDYAVAVQEGATLVRIGTAIFGLRSHTV